MDSVALSVDTSVAVTLRGAQLNLNPKTFGQAVSDGVSWNSVGTTTGKINVFHFKSYELGPSATIAFDVQASPPDDMPGNPVTVNEAMPTLVTMTAFQVTTQTNRTGTPGSSLRIRSKSSSPANLFWGNADTFGITLGNPAQVSWASDLGKNPVATGSMFEICNLDGANSITFRIMIAGRST